MRVLLVDPGSEGLLLSATLRGAGFEVVLGTLEQVPSAVCDVLVIAGDAPGALAALRALRDDGPHPDTKEHLAGYFIIDVPDLDIALQWAAKAPCRTRKSNTWLTNVRWMA